MTDLHFQHDGVHHYIRILQVDTKTDPDGLPLVVYEGMIDGREYCYWESEAANVWNLFQEAIAAYVEHTADDRIEIRRFTEGG